VAAQLVASRVVLSSTELVWLDTSLITSFVGDNVFHWLLLKYDDLNITF
jgi:ABC-type cobalamin transport system permease subunit